MQSAPLSVLGLTLALFGAGPVMAGAGEGEAIPAEGMAVAVPSGQSVTLQDVIWNVPGVEGLTLRFRFVAPAIGDGTVDFDTAATDMQHLCETFALPRVPEFEPRPEQVVISLSEAPVPFGEPAPDVVQFFESYRIEDGTCQWELF